MPPEKTKGVNLTNLPPHPGKVQIPKPLDGLPCQMPFFPGSEDGEMLGECPGDVEGPN